MLHENARLSSVRSPLRLGGLQVQVFTGPSSTTSGLIHNNDAVTSIPLLVDNPEVWQTHQQSFSGPALNSGSL